LYVTSERRSVLAVSKKTFGVGLIGALAQLRRAPIVIVYYTTQANEVHNFMN
jgi:hypothetical protein